MPCPWSLSSRLCPTRKDTRRRWTEWNILLTQKDGERRGRHNERSDHGYGYGARPRARARARSERMSHPHVTCVTHEHEPHDTNEQPTALSLLNETLTGPFETGPEWHNFQKVSNLKRSGGSCVCACVCCTSSTTECGD